MMRAACWTQKLADAGWQVDVGLEKQQKHDERRENTYVVFHWLVGFRAREHNKKRDKN